MKRKEIWANAMDGKAAEAAEVPVLSIAEMKWRTASGRGVATGWKGLLERWRWSGLGGSWRALHLHKRERFLVLVCTMDPWMDRPGYEGCGYALQLVDARNSRIMEDWVSVGR